MRTKYIFISGGVISGLGKGIIVSSVSLLLKSYGFKVAPIKCDPYLNVDAGTMNPIIHGEVFVTDDGLETDQDLGHYERFLHESLSKLNYMTSGQVYSSVIENERSFKYGGICVETIPHVPQEIIRRINLLAGKTKADFIVIEIGGTSGEYQNAMYLETARQMKLKNPNDVLHIHTAYLPLPPSLGELKSKPVQTSVKLLNMAGVQPDMIIGRAEKPIDHSRKEKIAVFCNLAIENIFSNPDVENIYNVPIILEEQNITERIIKKLKVQNSNVKTKTQNLKLLKQWKQLIKNIKNIRQPVKIAIVGKYFTSGDYSLEDAYICVMEAVKHACWQLKLKPEITWIDSEKLEKDGVEMLKKFAGIIVPQGWGDRGTEGKILAAGFARKNKIPYLGLCFGMQLACVEFARNVCGLNSANSMEINPKTSHPVIHVMSDQQKYLAKHQYGGTIRLGSWPCKLKKNTLLYNIYKNHKSYKNYIYERHRHRYEFNQKYKKLFEKNGMIFSGMSPDRKLVEAVELKNHPFFLGVQFHPEFKSRPLSPHPIFIEFIKKCQK